MTSYCEKDDVKKMKNLYFVLLVTLTVSMYYVYSCIQIWQCFVGLQKPDAFILKRRMCRMFIF